MKEKTKQANYNDTLTMAGRCLLLSIRNPDTLLTSILLPALMMLLFVSLFGKLIHTGGTSYANYIVPGILLQCAGQCSSSTAVMMNRDMKSGILHRYCTLPVRKASVLNGHILEAFARNMLTSAVVLLAALLVGFRPLSNPAGWCAVLVLLAGIILAFSCLSAVTGIITNSAEGASSLSALLIILPYLSSGFVPTDALPDLIRGFAEHQPLTPVIDTMRDAFTGAPLDTGLFMTALLWCAGLILVFYALALVMFYKKLGK